GLSFLLKRYFQSDYSVVGTARSGREAREKSTALSPEIILMDVQMPGISGLEVIRELSHEGGAKAFILVTAYERFDIAREALSMGVCDYLLKPVSKERLDVALRTASAYLDRVQMLNERELEFKDREQRLVPFVRTAFFVMARQKRGQTSAVASSDIALFREMLQLPSETGIMGIAGFWPSDGNVSTAYERFCSVLQYRTLAFAGQLEDMRYCAWFLPIKKETDTSQELGAFLGVLQDAFSAQLATGEMQLSYGQPEKLDALWRSWEQTITRYAISHSSGERFFAEELHQEQESEERAVNPLDSQFYDEIIKGHIALAGQALERLLQSLDQQGQPQQSPLQQGQPQQSPLQQSPLQRDAFYRIIAALSFAASRVADGGVLSEKGYREFMDFSDIERLWSDGAFKLFASRVRARFQMLQEKAATAGAHSPFVVRALQYIENHYQEQITLESAAEAIGISAGHLTRLMSDELKRGFARTLIDYRMQKAKELLKNPNVSIREVSQRCGYPDANYFARLFRRQTGQTPREYAARMEKGENSDA
ncbi:MAG: helix-turn-helix domain-containing protein, partial [Rectinema sp.]